MKSDRGDHVTGSLTDQAYDLLDELQKIAKELSSTVAAVSLAWVHSRPGVTSTIIGARTMKQLDSNLAALDLPLSTDHIERLDKSQFFESNDIQFRTVLSTTEQRSTR